VDRVLFEDLILWDKGNLLPKDARTWVVIGAEDLYEKELELRKPKSRENEEANKIGSRGSSPSINTASAFSQIFLLNRFRSVFFTAPRALNSGTMMSSKSTLQSACRPFLSDTFNNCGPPASCHVPARWTSSYTGPGPYIEFTTRKRCLLNADPNFPCCLAFDDYCYPNTQDIRDCPPPQPPPPPCGSGGYCVDPPPAYGGCTGLDICMYPGNGCPGRLSPVNDTCCCGSSPIVIDVRGDGYNLTSASDGVTFSLSGVGDPVRFSWTSINSDDAWLALDRNGNGFIDNGVELFGNFTPQSAPPRGQIKNGFRALAEFDRLQHGGNRDGQIDNRDYIFSLLRLWQDINHNGVSEQNELHPLMEFGIAMLDLDYKESKRRDQYGNQFVFRAKVKDIYGVQAGRWAWDVFLVKQ
jgi:hypothetical protein